MEAEISNLYAALSYVATKYLKKKLIFTSGVRDCEKQLRISGSTSYHLNGQAFDAQLYPYDKGQQAILGQIAEHYGFRWGGRFKPYDDVHFDNGNRVRPGSCTP